MPPKKRSSRRRKPQHGEGFFDVIKKVGGFLKDSKILSTVASMVPHPGVQAVGRVTGQLGLGRKRKSKALKLK